jgi:metal-responsive CopG/Arc/MetJ family transcriptional regulator
MSQKGDKAVKVVISLAPHVKEKLEEMAKDKGLSRSAMIAVAIDKYMREDGYRDK